MTRRADRELYFAYGSNLHFEQMRRRCPSSDKGRAAVLSDYKLIFPLFDEGWQGGVASVIASSGDQVHGVVYALNREDLLKLDEYEGLAEGLYRREKVRVSLSSEPPASALPEAWLYLVDSGGSDYFPPSRQYLSTIVAGARHHRLPDPYLAGLQAIPTAAPGLPDDQN